MQTNSLKIINVLRWRDYLLGDLDRPWTKRVLRLLLFGGVIILGLWFIYFALKTISMPYPIEYREGSTQVMTQFLLNGKNPYGLENQPLAMNNNGIVYNLFVLPLAAGLGNTLAVHRIVTFIFTLLCSVLISWTVFTSNKDAGIAIMAGLLTAMTLSARGGLGVFPASTGAFFYLAAMILPLRRTFDYRGLILSALLSLLAFYTKPYFAISFAIVAAYIFIFISRKRALVYGIIFAGLFAVSFIVIKALFPFYFTYTILSNASNATRDFGWLFLQLKELLREFYPSTIVLLLALVVGASRIRPPQLPIIEQISDLGTRTGRGPVHARPLDFFAFAFACSMFVFISLLGLHEGADMTYAYQLIMPPFFVWLLSALQLQNRLSYIAIPLLVFNTLSFTAIRFAPCFLDQNSSKEWARLYEVTDSSKHILNSPIIVSEMLRTGIQPVNTGKNEYFWHLKLFPAMRFIGPSYDVIRSDRKIFKDAIDGQVMNSGFDKIVWVRNQDFFAPSMMSLYYHHVESFDVEMPQTEESWSVEILEPNTLNNP